MTQLPVEDPSRQGSLMDRSRAYVRQSLLLRVALLATVVNHLAAITLVATHHLTLEWAGVLVLFSVMAWFFAVCLPLMNRSVRLHLGGQAVGYWGEVVEMFTRFFLCLATVLYTATLVFAALDPVF
jgi:hypothetical protein